MTSPPTEGYEEAEPKAFKTAVDEFFKDAVEIFAYFDIVLEHFNEGKSIQEELRKFREERPSIFNLIYAIFHKPEEVSDKIKRIGVEKEKVEKLEEFKKRFKKLAEEIDLFVLSEILS